MYSGRLKYINAKYGTNFADVNQIPPFLLENPTEKRSSGNNIMMSSLKRFFNEITVEQPSLSISNTQIQPNSVSSSAMHTSTQHVVQVKQLSTNADLKRLVDGKIQEIFFEFLDNSSLKSVVVPKTQAGGAGGLHALKVFRNDSQEGNVVSVVDFNQLLKFQQGLDDDDSIDEGASHEEFLYKKQFSDVLTTFVNSDKIFTDANLEYIVRFQYLIITLFTGLINAYIKHKALADNDVKFIYKGGTTMKIIHSQYLDLLNKCDCDEFKANIANCFNRSDSDYHVKISKNLLYSETYNTIYYDMNKIILLALKHIKKILIDHNKFFMDIQKNITSTDLQNLVPKMDNVLKTIKPHSAYFTNGKAVIGLQTENALFVEAVHANNPEFLKLLGQTVTTRDDFYITKNNLDDDTSKNVILGRLKHKTETDVNSNLFITSNETLKFSQNTRGDNYTETFLLSRIKYNFVIYYVNNDGTYSRFNSYSEIVDVSMNKQNASPNLVTTDDLFTLYRYTFQKGTPEQLSLEYTSYSIKGFLVDLMTILFLKAVYPWDDKKYKKRLYRSLFFMYIELVQNKLLTIDVLNCVTTTLSERLPINDFNAYIDRQLVNRQTSDLFKATVTSDFLEHTIRIKKNAIASGNALVLQELLDFTKEFHDTFEQFKRNLNIGNLTNCGMSACDVTQLGGDLYAQKYMKYLTKNKSMLKSIENNQF